MGNAPPNLRGGPLEDRDYEVLAARAIDRQWAERSILRRVDGLEGREILGRNGTGHYEGLAIPYIIPGEDRVREYRVRRDRPEIENGTTKGKYMAPPGRGNMLYVPVGVEPDWLTDATLPVMVTEGEFKAIALMRAGWHGLGESAERPRFLPVALPGVWSWKGTIGKVTNENGERVDEKGPIPDLTRLSWYERDVTIVFDRDAQDNDSVAIAQNMLARELQSRGATVRVFAWPKDAPASAKGVDDLLAAVGPDRVLALLKGAKKRKAAPAVVAADTTGWQSKLIRNATGDAKAILANAMLALRESAEWGLKHDVFALRTFALKAPWGFVGIWTDHQDALACEWLHRNGIFVPRTVASEAVEAVAHDSLVHPVREYLSGLAWDGVRRIESWLCDYLGAEDTDYVRAVGEKWLISAIARIERPGVKADHVLIIEGPQGAGKSTTFRVLGGDWYTDEIADLGSRDSSMQVAGTWVIELAELDAMSRPEISKTKAFISRTVDRFRPPYGRRLIEAPRQCVFGGSVNASNYLKDETGARRFWPVKCGSIDLDSLARDRDQIWAEAYAVFKGGATWWIDSPDLQEAAQGEQEARHDSDPWEELISQWVEAPEARCDPHGHPVAEFTSTRDSVTMADVLNHCVGKRPDMWTQVDKNRVGRCLRRIGFEFKLKRDGKSRTWRYLRAV